MDDAIRWNGRLSFMGAATSHCVFNTARIIDLISPLVLVYTAATAATCAGVGSYVSNHRSIFVLMNCAVLGCASSVSSICSPSLIPAAPSAGEPAGMVTPSTVLLPQSWMAGLKVKSPRPATVQPVSTRDNSAT